MARSRAHANLPQLSPIRSDTLVQLELRPYRERATPEELQAALPGGDRRLMDATERAYQRAQNEAKPRAYYSGKTTAYVAAHGQGAP